jgi:hypothetical protein
MITLWTLIAAALVAVPGLIAFGSGQWRQHRLRRPLRPVN